MRLVTTSSYSAEAIPATDGSPRNLAEPSPCVYVVSSRKEIRSTVLSRLQSARWTLREAVSGADALEKINDEGADLILLDPALPDLQPAELKTLLRSQCPRADVIVLNSSTGQPLPPSFLPNATTARILSLLEQSIRLASPLAGVAAQEGQEYLPGIIGISEAMQCLAKVTRLVSRRETTVLITGESGTGKDLLARAIHALSPRCNAPFVVINCAAIPETLVEAELFGFMKGAFTGAMQARTGKIQSAQGGTVFLDEIGELPLQAQAKLLRFLEQGELQRLGSSETFRVDVRIVAATNAQLRTLVTARQFREDLYYRLSVFPINIPPLRERFEDVLPLAQNFAHVFGGSGLSVANDAALVLQQHSWPGNVRELRNVIERASILVGGEKQITSREILI